MGHPSISNLFNLSPLRQVISDLLGAKPLPVTHGQIALRFPGDLCFPETLTPLPLWQRNWHIDGLFGHIASVKRGEIHHFTALVGVCLKDVEGDLAGNLVVFPRSHRLLNAHFMVCIAPHDASRAFI